jgi:hypothetical protein
MNTALNTMNIYRIHYTLGGLAAAVCWGAHSAAAAMDAYKRIRPAAAVLRADRVEPAVALMAVGRMPSGELVLDAQHADTDDAALQALSLEWVRDDAERVLALVSLSVLAGAAEHVRVLDRSGLDMTPAIRAAVSGGVLPMPA